MSGFSTSSSHNFRHRQVNQIWYMPWNGKREVWISSKQANKKWLCQCSARCWIQTRWICWSLQSKTLGNFT